LKLLSRVRVVDGRVGGKVTRELGGCGNQCLKRNAIAPGIAFIAEEEERPVLNDSAADGAAKLILDQLASWNATALLK
jgi:hypothetical protein